MIIVTGGAGFIGSAIVWGLNNLGISDILIVDHLGDGSKWKNLRNLKYIDYMEKTDFYNRVAANPDYIKCPTAIFHMGACSSTTEVDMSYMIKNNFEYSILLAEFARRKNIPFIYASSAATYGDTVDFSDTMFSIPSLKPLNKYGYSKQMFDVWLMNHGFFKSGKTIGLKFFNVYGPNEYHKGDMRSFILKGYEEYTVDKKIRLFKNATECRRDFIYIKDAVDMALFFLNQIETKPGIYNIGSGTSTSWDCIAELIANCSVHPPKPISKICKLIDMPDNISTQYQRFTQANISKIKNLGYNKTIRTIKEGVEEYIQNYISSNKYLGD